MEGVNTGTVTCLEGERHDLEDGDLVQFAEVEGMDGLSGDGPFPVTVICESSAFNDAVCD